MNEEIQRIKSKDYSQLDERLFNNIGASSELDGTLVKLAELQKYLLSQIDGIQNQQEKDAVLKASKIVMEMGSRVQTFPPTQCNCQCLIRDSLMQIGRIKKSLKGFSEAIRREMQDCIADISEGANNSICLILAKAGRKNSENLRLKSQIQDLHEEVEHLKKQNDHLKASLLKWEDAKTRRRNRSTADITACPPPNYNTYTEVSSYLHTETALSTDRATSIETSPAFCFFGTESNGKDTPRVPGPLRKDFFNRASCNEQANKAEWASCQKLRKCEQGKENLFLRMKGAEVREGRKSTKKIKLISMM